jgi:Tfp pilus assembly protein PilZ
MSLAFSRDVSLGGMFIETAIPLPIGSTITVRFNLDQKEKVVTAIAEVAYHVERMGMGVLFTQMSRPDRDAIREYVETLQAPSGDESARNQSGSDK